MPGKPLELAHAGNSPHLCGTPSLVRLAVLVRHAKIQQVCTVSNGNCSVSLSNFSRSLCPLLHLFASSERLNLVVRLRLARARFVPTLSAEYLGPAARHMTDQAVGFLDSGSLLGRNAEAITRLPFQPSTRLPPGACRDEAPRVGRCDAFPNGPLDRRLSRAPSVRLRLTHPSGAA